MIAIDLEATAHRFLLVILPLNEGLTSLVVLPGHPRRIVFHVINPPRGFVHPTTGESLDDFLIVHVQRYHFVYGHAGLIKGLGLGNSAREAIKKKTVETVRLGDTVFHKRNDECIGDQFAGAHIALCFLPKLRARSACRAEHVPRGDLRNGEPVHQELGLRSFSSARGAQ